jgi:hypothetical protein
MELKSCCTPTPMCSISFYSHKYMVGRTRDLWIKRGGKSWLAELFFLVPPSGRAKTHKNGLPAVCVHAWLQSHLLECFIRFQSLFHAHSLHTLFAASTWLCLCTAYLLYFNLVSTSSSSFFGVCATYSDLLLLQLCFVFALWFNIDFSL